MTGSFGFFPAGAGGGGDFCTAGGAHFTTAFGFGSGSSALFLPGPAQSLCSANFGPRSGAHLAAAGAVRGV